MSGNCDALALKEDDVKKMIACGTHLGTKQVDFQMEQYVYKRTTEGIHLFNIRKIWDKFLLAARAIAAIENPGDVFVISSRPYGQRAILKYAAATGAVAIAGRFTPGTFTNYIQKNYREPRLLVVTDPRADHQAVTEASYVNIPVIALCNSDTPLRYVDIAIPTNNKSVHAIGLAWWFLAREVLRLRGTISREVPWEVMVDLYFYRDPEEIEKDEQAAVEKSGPVVEPGQTQENWNAEGGDQPEEWTGQVAAPAAPAPAFDNNWSDEPVQDWSNTESWGGTGENWGQ